MPDRHTADSETLAEVQRSFAEFAADYAELPLYHRIASAMSTDELAGLLLNAAPGQARPVLFLAALHDLVLRDRSLPAARWYPSVVGHAAVPDGDPWPDVRATVVRHRAILERTIGAHTTQTNEVNRSTYLAVLLDLASVDLPSVPVGLVELGSSAGLLLGVNRFRVQVGSATTGPDASAVRCIAQDRSRTPLESLRIPRIESTCGIDLAPVAVSDVERLRWLEACLWPEVPGRVERHRAAVAELRKDPPTLLRGDMADTLPSAAAHVLAESARHLIVTTSWALTYVRPDRRKAISTSLADLANTGVPVSWISAEPVGCVPGLPDTGVSRGETVLGLRRWRDGVELTPQVVGTCHPHGEWLEVWGETGAV